jgi:hypothetical protein
MQELEDLLGDVLDRVRRLDERLGTAPAEGAEPPKAPGPKEKAASKKRASKD